MGAGQVFCGRSANNSPELLVIAKSSEAGASTRDELCSGRDIFAAAKLVVDGFSVYDVYLCGSDTIRRRPRITWPALL